jgi:hypothetical protein
MKLVGLTVIGRADYPFGRRSGGWPKAEIMVHIGGYLRTGRG